MWRTSALITAVTALTACSQAAAVVPDSRNPAHCIAAFHYYAYWMNKGDQPRKATGMMARAIFEMNKIKAVGGSVAAAKAEGIALTKAYAANERQMDALFLACGSAQDADPKFHEQASSLIETALSAGNLFE